jgi:protein involved in polysaccharide export with SLBB domain
MEQEAWSVERGAWSVERCLTRRAPRFTILCLGLCLVAGCALAQPHLDQALMATAGGDLRNEGVDECYVVHCPDVVEIRVAGRRDLSGRRTVAPDGRIDLGNVGRLRVEGRTVPENERRLALVAGVALARVQFRVVEFHSQQVYLLGPGIGRQRAVAYQGPETVLDLLQRTGGIRPGAEPNNVYVIRPHLAQDKGPEVFRIDLRKILVNQDHRTNLRLQPFDQVFIGETAQSSLAKCVPPCLLPLYRTFWGLTDDETTQERLSNPGQRRPA